jgi:hypothetical protein
LPVASARSLSECVSSFIFPFSRKARRLSALTAADSATAPAIRAHRQPAQSTHLRSVSHTGHALAAFRIKSQSASAICLETTYSAPAEAATPEGVAAAAGAAAAAAGATDAAASAGAAASRSQPGISSVPLQKRCA